MADKCTRPPLGWICTREAGHEGPCAAAPLTGVISDALLRDLTVTGIATMGEVRRLAKEVLELRQLRETVFNTLCPICAGKFSAVADPVPQRVEHAVGYYKWIHLHRGPDTVKVVYDCEAGRVREALLKK